MIGFFDHYKQLKYHLTRPESHISPIVLVLVGMAGIGKTTLASQIFEDSDIVEHYDLRAWVKIGGKCQLKEIPRRILAKLNPDLTDRFLSEGEDHEIARCLRENLKGKRYLFVVDDVWNKYTSNGRANTKYLNRSLFHMKEMEVECCSQPGCSKQLNTMVNFLIMSRRLGASA